MSYNNTKKYLYNYIALDFFAGSGLVSYSIRPYFKVVWANDICQKKAEVYISNHDKKHFHLDSIENIHGKDLPAVDLSWASFPCQDLSLAGKTEGINAKRSGLVWQWLRVMDEMPQKPDLLVAENVEGFISSAKGEHYKIFHMELEKRGYIAGAILLDAANWIPQSRPRIFVIAIKSDINIPKNLISETPSWVHNESIKRVSKILKNWIFWYMPSPPSREKNLMDIIEWDDTKWDSEEKTQRLFELIPARHLIKLNEYDTIAVTGYKRTRNNKQTLELRFDGTAGCLRTPQGGSSRQFLIYKKGQEYYTRLLLIREVARLMGVPDTYKLPKKYNDAYKAMGDAVAVPVVNYLAKSLLLPLAVTIKCQREREEQNDSLISEAYGL